MDLIVLAQINLHIKPAMSYWATGGSAAMTLNTEIEDV